MTHEEAQRMAIAYFDMFDPIDQRQVVERLQGMDGREALAVLMKMKNPTTALILSIVLGFYGIDRFYIGEIGMGVLKLITCGGCCIWWLVDIFNIQSNIRTQNFEYLIANTPEPATPSGQPAATPE